MTKLEELEKQLAEAKAEAGIETEVVETIKESATIPKKDAEVSEIGELLAQLKPWQRTKVKKAALKRGELAKKFPGMTRGEALKAKRLNYARYFLSADKIRNVFRVYQSPEKPDVVCVTGLGFQYPASYYRKQWLKIFAEQDAIMAVVNNEPIKKAE